MRERDPNILVWVAVHPIYSGADRLLLTRPTILVRAFEHVVEDFVKKVGSAKATRDAFEKLGAEVVPNSAEDFTRRLQQELARWTRIRKETGIKIE